MRSHHSPIDIFNRREEYAKTLQFQIAEKERTKREEREIGMIQHFK